MCGASSQQNQVQAEDIQTLQDYDAMMKNQYANQQALYAKVNSVLQPIFEKGPNQEGFTQAERQNLTGQAIEGTAENYEAAAKATNEHLAALGGGDEPLTVGAQEQMKAEVAQSAAGEESKEESQILSQDYAQGYSQFQNAEEGEMAIASGENPLGYATATTNQANAAGNETNAVQQANNSWINAAIGAAGAIGGGYLSGRG